MRVYYSEIWTKFGLQYWECMIEGDNGVPIGSVKLDETGIRYLNWIRRNPKMAIMYVRHKERSVSKLSKIILNSFKYGNEGITVVRL